MRAEPVASFRIEGLEFEAHRLLRAEVARGIGEDPSDVTVKEVLGNIDAVVFAIEQIHAGNLITIELILEVHWHLLARTRLEQ